MSKTVSVGALRQHMTAILKAAGSSAEEARQVADNLVMANLSGHDSHGVGMIPRYVESLLEGGLQLNASVKVNLDAGSMLALEFVSDPATKAATGRWSACRRWKWPSPVHSRWAIAS